MPRVGEPVDLPEDYPWAEWNELLKKAPTKTIFFGKDDFSVHPETFAKKARRYLGPGIYVGIRGEEVMVTLNA